MISKALIFLVKTAIDIALIIAWAYFLIWCFIL